MNILFLMNNSLSPFEGGIERTTFNLINELKNDSKFKIFGVFRRIPEKIRGVVCIENIILNGKQIDDYIRQYRIDIVVFPAGPWYANLLKQFNSQVNCKIITCLHSPPGVGLQYKISHLNLEWNKKNLSLKIRSFPSYFKTYIEQPMTVYRERNQYHTGYLNSDAYVLLSKSFFGDFREYANIKDINKLYAIGNALSFAEFFDKDTLLQKKNDVLVVSRFHETSKRITYAIKAWAILNETKWNFKIVGFGKDRDLYQNLVTELKVKNISFEGKQNPISYYKDAKIFLMTSAFEGWGMTITEALQMGCVPIVMDSFSSLHDIIEHRYNGLIIKNGDINGMASAIRTLIDDEKEWLRLSENAIESASRFTIEKTTKKWKDLFNSLV